MSDPKPDKLPPAIEDALKHVHEPPPTPREEMWQQIQARRQEQKIVRGRFGMSPTVRLVVAAAAVLVLGIFLGRLWDAGSGSNGPTTVAQEPTPATSSDPRGDDSARPADSQLAQQQPGDVLDDELSQAQLLHAAKHFTRSGVLLAQFAETVEEEDPLDPELHRWARDLLTNTRLLLDSPLARDAQYRKLLRDLEFTLAQIVQASAAEEEEEERKWVAGQVSDRSLVERLRLVVPALPGSRDI